MNSSSNFSSLYTFNVQFSPPLLMLHFLPILAFKSLTPLLPTLYLFPLLPHYRLLLLAVSLHLLLSLPPDSLGVFRWNIGGLRARSTELLHLLLSHPVDFICIKESNLNSSSSFPIPDSLLLCVLIAPTPGLAFSLVMPRTLAAALSFSSGRAYPSLNFLPPLFLRLISILIMQGSTSL